MKLPERISVIKVISYKVEYILDEMTHIDRDKITIGDILEYIQPWIESDFDGDTNGLIYQDENGEEL
jgi:hypothetical protein